MPLFCPGFNAQGATAWIMNVFSKAWTLVWAAGAASCLSFPCNDSKKGLEKKCIRGREYVFAGLHGSGEGSWSSVPVGSLGGALPTPLSLTVSLRGLNSSTFAEAVPLYDRTAFPGDQSSVSSILFQRRRFYLTPNQMLFTCCRSDSELSSHSCVIFHERGASRVEETVVWL